ncbi:MAG: hypothetical protein ACE5R6_01395 [Candidatus Heimdallarchaeota archaeon]
MRARISIMVAGGLVIVFVLVVLFTVSGLWVPNSELPPNETETTTPQGTFLPKATIYLKKLESEPEYYVELTEEELEQFPVLQVALQGFEGNEQTELMYMVHEREAFRIQRYIWDKLRDKYGESCEDYPSRCIKTIFEYQGDFYYFLVAVP